MNGLVRSIVAIDIATSKITVVVANIYSSTQIEVLGQSSVPNNGIEKGRITDLNALTASLKDAVVQAQASSKSDFHSVWISIPSAELKMDLHTDVFEKKDHSPITKHHLDKLVEQAKKSFSSTLAEGYRVVNIITVGYLLNDDDIIVERPIGMAAQKIKGVYQILSLPENLFKNIQVAIQNVNPKLKVENIIISDLATAETNLLTDEKRYGVCMVDIGASNTTISIYNKGFLHDIYRIPLGGEMVTADIATHYKTTREEAERLKIEYGHLNIDEIKFDKMVSFQAIHGKRTISQADLIEVISERYRELADYIWQYLVYNDYLNDIKHGIVFTGEAAHINGLIPLFEQRLNIDGITMRVNSNPKELEVSYKNADYKRNETAYLTTVGLIAFSQKDKTTLQLRTDRLPTTETWFARLMNWFREIHKKWL